MYYNYRNLEFEDSTMKGNQKVIDSFNKLANELAAIDQYYPLTKWRLA